MRIASTAQRRDSPVKRTSECAEAKKGPDGIATGLASLFAVTRKGPAQGGKAGCGHQIGNYTH